MGEESASVKGNIAELGIETITIGGGGSYQVHLSDLVPGQVAHLFLDSKSTTDQFTFNITNITPALPPAEQNQIWGDDLFVLVHDSWTSDEDLGNFAGYLNSDTSFSLDNPGTGIVRLAVMGDWSNAGNVSVDVEIMEKRGPAGKALAKGSVPQSDSELILVEVPFGTDMATFELSWNNHWGRYPTDDLDIIIYDPFFNPIWDGATLASPERVEIDTPLPGTYYVVVDGYTVWSVHGGNGSKYSLRAYDQDGNSF